ncbi:thioredoxin-like domain-containing protein [Kiloniella sp. b19]|uniref:thioredoxin-like domain-containing protein n=1 Tax=Kiloniella sp. GXU_MW_B19 TaxID=3141326 RepID=UPI0031DD8135
MFGSVHAPEINQPDLEWFNCKAPVSLADLRGRVVILDFWTYCCINCHHVLPALKAAEEAFPDDLTVVGVHSPKFDAERDSEHLRQAILRHDIRHPVVQDTNMTLWQHYAVRAWPTLVFISPDGYVIGNHSGEVDADALIVAIADIRTKAQSAHLISPSPLELVQENRDSERLSFPGQIRAFSSGNPGLQKAKWMLADSGHNQIVLFEDSTDGKPEETLRLGTGQDDLVDGSFEDCCFSNPQGLVAHEDFIYVADTGNHALRRIDLKNRIVETLAGDGRRGPVIARSWRGDDSLLASPWDLALRDDILFIANAGTHQILGYDLNKDMLSPLAGNGIEGLLDGDAMAAQLAQPSGLALDSNGQRLYFTDSETSSIRFVELEGHSTVHTIAGQGLFEFGFRDGDAGESLFQHPLALVWRKSREEENTKGELVVADSYNNALRVIDLEDQTVTDLPYNSYSCSDDLCIPLMEPAGIAVTENGILVSDCNNHRIVMIDEKKEKRSTLYK